MHNEGFSETVKPIFLKRMWYNKDYHRNYWFFSLWWIGFLFDWIIWTESTGVNSRRVQNQSALKSGVPGINVGSLYCYKKCLRIGIYCIPWKGLYTKTWHKHYKTGSRIVENNKLKNHCTRKTQLLIVTHKLTENKPHTGWQRQSLRHLFYTQPKPPKYAAIL